MTRNEMISKLMNVLPYPVKWYNGLADKQLKAIYQRELNKVIQQSIQRDKVEVSNRMGLTSF